MTILSEKDASCMAGVSQQTIHKQINSGELSRTPEGIDLSELIRVYPNLKPLANLKLRAVKQSAGKRQTRAVESRALAPMVDIKLDSSPVQSDERQSSTVQSEATQSDTVQLLVRELEWNKELLEQTNQNMAKQLAEQRAMIADQARRLDEKDRFWARQIEIAQSLLPAPEPQKRKKIFGIF